MGKDAQEGCSNRLNLGHQVCKITASMYEMDYFLVVDCYIKSVDGVNQTRSYASSPRLYDHCQHISTGFFPCSRLSYSCTSLLEGEQTKSRVTAISTICQALLPCQIQCPYLFKVTVPAPLHVSGLGTTLQSVGILYSQVCFRSSNYY